MMPGEMAAQLRAAQAMRESVVQIVEDLERFAEDDRPEGDWSRGRAAGYSSAADWLRRYALARWPVDRKEDPGSLAGRR